jgi:Dyp-type peroxidase family
MSINLEQTRINPEDQQFQPMLANLQCNILKSHGRDFAVHIFLKFTAQPDDVKAWIRNFSQAHVTSALEQYHQNKNYTENGIRGGLVGAFFLSAKGYELLGFDVDRFEDNDETFREGMKHKDFDLFGKIFDKNNKDPDSDEWEAGFQEDIHAMILLARDNKNALKADAENVMAGVANVATVLTAEYGEVLRNKTHQGDDVKEQPIEHFGYVDGRSNPVFLEKDFQDDIKKETAPGDDRWNPAANLSLVLVADPHTDADDSFGSYFVFRKLEQNVKGFNSGIAELAGELGVDPNLAGAFCVGRFKDGTPVTLQGTDGLGAVNNFKYKPDDKSGKKCPAHAHIRKVNPRGTTPFTSLDSERNRRIVRRGIPYGEANNENPPSEGVGLLFMCYQRDINEQFEFIQRTWADNPNFPRLLVFPGTGDDPLIGQDTDRSAAQNWSKGWGSSDREDFNFGGYITLMGGEYFFAPSISFLKSI